MKVIHVIAFTLLVIGGLNWLCVAFGLNIVEAIFGMGTMVTDAIYFLVGISAIYEAIMHIKNCKACSMNKAMPMQQPVQPK